MNCNHCDKYLVEQAGRSDRLYCSDTCRKAAQRYRRKLTRLGVKPMSQAELSQAAITLDSAVFRRDMSVAEAIAGGFIKIEI